MRTSMLRRLKLAIGVLSFIFLALVAPAQIGGSGWVKKTVTFKVQSPYNTNVNTRYWFTNNIYHCLVYSNDVPFAQGNTTLPRTEQRFNPDYTNGEIQYQATLMAVSNENSYCVFQIHSGDAQSPTFGSTTFMLFWFTSDGGSVHDYSGTELANNLANKWFQLNLDHNLVTGTIRVWINQKLVWTQQDNGAGDFYFKDGVYEQSHGPTLQMDTYITNILEWTSSGTNPPAAPTGLVATPAIGQIGLAWSSSVGATNYNLKRATTSGGPFTTITSQTGISYTDTHVTNGTVYYYVVTGVDSFGESSNSTQVSAFPISTGYQLAVTPAQASLNAGGSTNYTVTLTTNSSFNGSVSFGLTGLPSGASASFNPPALSTNGSSTLTVQTTAATLGGNYSLVVSGTNGSFIVTVPVSLALAGASTNPGTLFWNGNGGLDTNWSTAYNWTNVTAGGTGPPGINNTVVFTNLATATGSALTAPGSGIINPANINSAVNASFTISGMTNFANTLSSSPVYHNLGISSGNTLTLGGLLVGGFTLYAFGDNSVVNQTISGANATLQVTNGGVTVSENSANDGTHNATLDLSGLDTFVMTGTQIRTGVEGSGSFHNASGVIYLAKTNTLTLTSGGYSSANGSGSPDSGNPALYLGHNSSSFGNGSQLYLGVSNRLCLDYATIGRGDTNALLAFNPAFLGQNPSAVIRGTNGGATRVGVYVVGDGSSGAQANNAPSTNDFTGGSVDAMINYLCVGRGRDGNSSTVGGSGVLTFDQGTINANTLAIGFVYPAGSNSPAMGIVNVNDNGTLMVNSNLTLGYQAIGAGGVPMLGVGTLNLNGGTVQTTNLLGGGGISTINLNSGTLDLQYGNPAPGKIAGLSTLNLGANGVYDPALVTSAASITASNAIVIAPNGTLAGNTVITAPGLTVNGTVSPGTSGAGWITNNGPVILGAGGNCVITVQNATATPATSWSFWQINGGLSILSVATNPFTISLQTADSPAVNFSYATNYDWLIATATSGMTNYDPAKFTVDDSLFENDLAGGYFYIRTNSHSLILSFTNNRPPSARPATLTRTGSVMAIPVTSLTPQWSDPDGDAVTLIGVSSSTNGINNTSTDGTYIYYTNANNVTDTITYTVQDIRTNPPAIYRAGDTVQTAIGTIIILPPRPVIGGVSLAGGNLIFSGSGGLSNGSCYVLSSTNLTLPLAQWPRIATNTFDGSGNFNFTNTEDPNQSPQFYRLQTP